MFDANISCSPQEIGECLLHSKEDERTKLQLWYDTLTTARDLGVQLHCSYNALTTDAMIDNCLNMIETAIAKGSGGVAARLECAKIARVCKKDKAFIDVVRLTILDKQFN